jgi:hypothetical protein
MPYVKYARLKSDYSRCLHKVIDYSVDVYERRTNYNRMQQIEKILKEEFDDEVEIIVTTQKTNPGIGYSRMEDDKIDKQD